VRHQEGLGTRSERTDLVLVQLVIVVEVVVGTVEGEVGIVVEVVVGRQGQLSVAQHG